MYEHHHTHLGQAKGQVSKKGTPHYFALPVITLAVIAFFSISKKKKNKRTMWQCNIVFFYGGFLAKKEMVANTFFSGGVEAKKATNLLSLPSSLC